MIGGPPGLGPSTDPVPDLVSVVVPVYEAETYLRESLDSIVGQTYEPVEIIVMDDASTDGSTAIIESYGEEVRHLRNPENLGQFPNVNRGLSQARGEIVAVFHADDVYDPEILEVAVHALGKNPTAGAVFCLDRFMDEAGAIYDRVELPPELRGGGLLEYPDVLENLLLHMNTFLRTPGAVVRSSIYRRLGGFRTDLGSAGDFEMWLRIARHAPLLLLDRHLYSYRHRVRSEGARYQTTRRETDVFFHIVSEHLAEGGDELVSPRALRAFRAHLAEDRLLLGARAYAAGQRSDVRKRLGQVTVRDLLGSSEIDGIRLTLVKVVLHALTHLPRIPPVARFFGRRWGT